MLLLCLITNYFFFWSIFAPLMSIYAKVSQEFLLESFKAFKESS